MRNLVFNKGRTDSCYCGKILDLCSAKIIQKIFETNSIFHVKQRTMGKVQLCFSGDFYSTDKIFISGEGLCTKSIKF